MADILEKLVQLPKAHLHAHMDGCCGRALWDATFPGDDPVFQGGDLAQFLDHYFSVQNKIRERLNNLDIIQSVYEEAVQHHVYHLELSVGVRNMGGAAEQFVEQAQSLAAQMGLSVSFLFMTQRDYPEADIRHILSEAKRLAKLGYPVSGLACAGPQTPGGLGKLEKILQEEGRDSLAIVPHAGELSDPPSDIWDALRLRPRRIAHGNQAIHDPELVERLRRDGICLDMAPSSNIILGVTQAAHPFPELVRAGVPCSISADDSLIFGITLSDEYLRLYNMGMTLHELAHCARASFVHSTATSEVKERGLLDVDRWEKSL